jgi:hypothetical protein
VTFVIKGQELFQRRTSLGGFTDLLDGKKYINLKSLGSGKKGNIEKNPYKNRRQK